MISLRVFSWLLLVISVVNGDKKGLIRGDFINKCAISNGFCDPKHAECTNGPGSTWFCECHEGYEDFPIPKTRHGFFCKDKNECEKDNGGCHEHALCINTDGSRMCECKPGFSGNGMQCKDVNECQELNGGCLRHAVCLNTIGSRTCTCLDGTPGDYGGKKKQCIEPCSVPGSEKCHTDATCFSHHLLFTCVCKDGYEGNGFECIDIDECREGTDHCPDISTTCKNNIGSFTCECNPGYKRNDDNDCKESDPCLDPIELERDCAVYSTCTSKAGVKTCKCLEGYIGSDDGSVCGYYIMDGCGVKGGTKYKVLTFGEKRDGHTEEAWNNIYNLHLMTKSKELMKYQLWYADINGHIRSAAFPKFLFYEDDKTEPIVHKGETSKLFELIAEDKTRRSCSMSWVFKKHVGNYWRVKKGEYSDARTTIQDLGLTFNCENQVSLGKTKFCVQTHIDWYEDWIPPIMRTLCVGENSYPWSQLFISSITLP